MSVYHEVVAEKYNWTRCAEQQQTWHHKPANHATEPISYFILLLVEKIWMGKFEPKENNKEYNILSINPGEGKAGCVHFYFLVFGFFLTSCSLKSHEKWKIKDKWYKWGEFYTLYVLLVVWIVPNVSLYNRIIPSLVRDQVDNAWRQLEGNIFMQRKILLMFCTSEIWNLLHPTWISIWCCSQLSAVHIVF